MVCHLSNNCLFLSVHNKRQHRSTFKWNLVTNLINPRSDFFLESEFGLSCAVAARVELCYGLFTALLIATKLSRVSLMTLIVCHKKIGHCYLPCT